MTSNPAPDRNELKAMIDRHGAAVAKWPDRAAANRLRAAVLADRSLRAYLDDMAAIEKGLDAVRSAVDDEIDASGAVDRLAASVMSRLTPRRANPMRWIAAAAVIAISAGLGSVAEMRLASLGYGTASTDTVVLDPLVFGPTQDDGQ